MRKLTVRECNALQRRDTDAFGSKYPFPGKWADYASPYPMEEVELPDGWVFVHIPTWGLHIQPEAKWELFSLREWKANSKSNTLTTTTWG